MNFSYPHLLERKEYLEQLLVEIQSQMEVLPSGNLRIRNDKGELRFYQVTEQGDKQGKYIRKKDKSLACHLAQKDYIQRLHKEAESELKSINHYLKNHKEAGLENIYEGLKPYRKELVKPLVITDCSYAKQWENQPYQSNPYHPEEKVYATKKDELVRSKSEVLLADMYYELGIPYRYEAKLRLENGKIKYPDFTLLKMRTREVIYHEHLGLMDQEKYRKINLEKLDDYRKNGIYLGKNLIITYEGEGCYLNIKEIKQMIQGIIGK